MFLNKLVSKPEINCQSSDKVNALFRSFVENSPEGVVFINDGDEIVYANKAANGLVADELEEEFLIGKKIAAVFIDERNDIVNFFNNNSTDQHIDLELLFNKKNGRPRYAYVTCTKFKDRDGSNIKIIQFKDITDPIQNYVYKFLHQEIIDDRTEKIKEDILANASHQLRNPLNALITNLMALQNQLKSIALDDNIKNILNNTVLASKQLGKYTDEILGMSKIERNEIEAIEDVFLLKDIYSELAAVHSLAAAEKKIELVIEEASAELAGPLFGYKILFKQVLDNLISNSLKYTEQGKVTLKTALIEKNDEEISLNIIVQDTGIGIPGQELRNIFKPFKQIKERQNGARKGTGLGLAYVDAYVKKMKGEIIVNSSLEEGSEFTLFLKFKAVKAEQEAVMLLSGSPSFQWPARELKILFVDDEAVNRMGIIFELNRYFSEHAGCQIIEANDGQEALDIFKREEFDLVIIDGEMPVMNGFTAIRKMREINLAVPILALSGYGDQKERFLEHGADDLLVKPIYDIENLIDKLAAIFFKEE